MLCESLHLIRMVTDVPQACGFEVLGWRWTETGPESMLLKPIPSVASLRGGNTAYFNKHTSPLACTATWLPAIISYTHIIHSAHLKPPREGKKVVVYAALFWNLQNQLAVKPHLVESESMIENHWSFFSCFLVSYCFQHKIREKKAGIKHGNCGKQKMNLAASALRRGHGQGHGSTNTHKPCVRDSAWEPGVVEQNW